MGLFGLFEKKKQSKPVKKVSKSNKPIERMDRLTPDGELPWGWVTTNKAFTDKTYKEYSRFCDAYYKSKKKGMLQEYAALKSLIIYMEDVQKLCKRKGECFAYWASYMVARPKDIAEYKAHLNALEAKLKTVKK